MTRRPRRFPGLYCPGLIEAQHGRPSNPPGGTCFRGSIAPASLKPRGCSSSSRTWRRFPGLYCPGLIEAIVSMCTGRLSASFPGLYCPGLIEARQPSRAWPSLSPFPGLYCPGLIEAIAQPPEAGGPRLRFRGSIAPASLKRQHRLQHGRAGRRFRGSIAPASLKRLVCHWPHVAVTVSGALLPRPH